MMRFSIGLAVLGIGLAGMAGVDALERRLDVEAMAEASSAFLASLSEDQRNRASFEFESDERMRHHFIPTSVWSRNGVQIEELNAEQRAAAQNLLRAGLSERGRMTANDIMEVEGILGQIEGGQGQFPRNAQDYWVSVFGTPSTEGTWGWRWEGHHLSLHFTVVEGNISVSTPMFLAASPAEVPDGYPRAGLRALSLQEDAARALLASFDADQRAMVIYEDVAPADVLTGARLEVDPLDPAGLRASAFNDGQRDLLVTLIDAYVSVMADDIAALRMSKIREAGIENISFAWAGGTEPGVRAYYRVQGPTFLIEFDNAQNDPNHIHTTFRDFEGDLGRDLLREHLQAGN